MLSTLALAQRQPAMENQSMRRRQTVLGEQLLANGSGSLHNGSSSQVSGGASQQSGFLAVPNTSVPSINAPSSVGRHMRTFSRISTRPPPPGVNGSSQSLQSSARSMGGHSASGTGAGLGAGLSAGLGVPTPDDLGPGGTDALSVVSAHDDEVDPALMSGAVDPAAYLARQLAGADPASILQFGERLRAQAQRANDADQRSLQHSHKALTTVASNVARLVPAVADLHRQVADLSLVSDAMRQDAFSHAGGGPGGSRRASAASFDGEVDAEDGAVPFDRRQSMLVLNSAWASDLGDLFKRVDGAQRVLPPAPGRHVVLEEHNWSEVNLVTQKPVRPVLVVVLNDFLLVAAPKQGRFAHVHHLPLDETLECSIDERSKVLRVARGATQIGLLAPGLARLRVVYAEVFKHMELASSRRLSTRASSSGAGGSAGQGISGGTGTAGGPVSGLGNAGFGGPGGRGRARSVQHTRRVSHSSISSIPEATVEQRNEAVRVMAEIDRQIALRNWEKATELCMYNDENPALGSAIAERRKTLTNNLLTSLTDRRMALMSDQATVLQQLVRLGRGQDAKHALLRAAATDIETQARDVQFMGDVLNYISQMAAIYFQTIIATVRVYRKAFPSREDSSFVVAWVKSQVELYAAIFNRQLFRISPELRAYQQCREVSRYESAQLRELNLDMEFMLRYVWSS